MKQHVVAAALACWIGGAVAASTSPSAVVDAFVRAGKTDADLAGKVNAIRRRPIIILVPGILGSKLTSQKLGDIWGGDGLPDLEKLKLPAELVSETAASDVRATLLDKYFGDQYGESFTAIRAAASKVGIDATSCGYDWRRDLRSGAADLEACIKALGPDPRTLIFLSHSMGGLVTTVWNAKHDSRVYSSQHLVGGIVLLGSPLRGSCEILRMIHEGYRQPVENSLNAGRRFEYLYEKRDAFGGDFVNALTRWATDGVRTAILTWPGALELSPKATFSDEEGRACVPARPQGAEGGPALISHYQPEFWASVTGQDLLRGAEPPPHFAAVLARAKEFRDGFEPSRPRAPLYAYFSRYWVTPERAIPGPNGRLPRSNTWTTLEGDGRVPLPAGGSRPTEWLSGYTAVSSVHGGLPKDEEFRKHFLAGRLPNLVAALTAYQLISELGTAPAVIAAYARAGGVVPVVDEFKGALDTISDKGASAPPRSPLGADIVKVADRFRADLCRTTTLCSATYSVAKARSDTPAEQAWAFAGVLGNEERSVPDRASAAAQVGLANARLGQFRSASHVLASASVELERSIELPTISSAGRQQLTDLKNIVDRNLAVTLRESGQCQAAKVLLLSVPGSQTRYASDLATKCLDRDTGLYQALGEF